MGVGDIGPEGPFQVRHTAERALAQHPICQIRKPTLHPMQPRGGGGMKGRVKRGCAARHAGTRACLWVWSWSPIRCRSRSGGHGPVPEWQEMQKFLVPVLGQACGDDRAPPQSQGGEEGGGAMAAVVMGAGGRVRAGQRQRRWCTVQGLDWAFRVHAPHQGMRRWVEIEPHPGPHLLGPMGVGAELEGLLPMQLQAMRARCATPRWH